MATDVAKGAAPTDTVLPYSELNRDGHSSILFIHGAFTNRGNWDLVTPHLPSIYHILLPDLPGHGQAHAIRPFSKQSAARLLAELIRTQAINGKAHVVGASLGAYVAIELACSYPEVVNDVFITGVKVIPRVASLDSMARMWWFESKLESLLPLSVTSWLMDGTDLAPSDPKLATLDLRREIMECITLSDGDDAPVWPSAWPARTFIMSAGKSGIVPSADRAEDAIKLRDIAREKNAETSAWTHPLMRHPWDRQAPELFAKTVVRLFERQAVDLNDGFIEL